MVAARTAGATTTGAGAVSSSEPREPRIPAIATGQRARHVVGEPVQRAGTAVSRATYGAPTSGYAPCRIADERRPEIEFETRFRRASRGCVEPSSDSASPSGPCTSDAPATAAAPRSLVTGMRGLAARRRDHTPAGAAARATEEEAFTSRLPFTTRAISRSAPRGASDPHACRGLCFALGERDRDLGDDRL